LVLLRFCRATIAPTFVLTLFSAMTRFLSGCPASF
jgi:hypothetical protein